MQNFRSVKLTDKKVYQTKYLVLQQSDPYRASYWRKFDFRLIFYVNINIKGL